jgi:hypothetical protein
MSFAWQHFLELAEHLVKDQAAPGPGGGSGSGEANASGLLPASVAGAPQEAAFRTSVSRAYYAAYHSVREYLEHTGSGTPPKGDAHRWVWDTIKATQRRQARQISENGYTMSKARKAADYDLGAPSWDRASGVVARNWAELADFSILTAKRIQKLVADIRPQP